jgi:hypothetical protein
MSEPSPPAEWAVLFVRGALKIGMPVEEIVQHLVGRQLSRDEAVRAVKEAVGATPQPPPDWAVELVRGTLRIGMPAPLIEEQLVSRGLSAEEAKRIVRAIVDGTPLEKATGVVNSARGRVVRLMLSALLGGVCLLIADWIGGGISVNRSLFWIVPAVGAIWIAELSGTDSDFGGYACIAGWVLLLLTLGYRMIFLAGFFIARFL